MKQLKLGSWTSPAIPGAYALPITTKWISPLGAGATYRNGACISANGTIWANGSSTAGQRKLLKSTSGGDTWEQVDSPWSAWGISAQCDAMAVDNSNEVVYALVNGVPNGGRLYWSNDDGSTWHYNDKPSACSAFTTSDRLYVFADGSVGVWAYYGGMFKTTDKGATWTQVGALLDRQTYHTIAIEKGTGIVYFSFFTQGIGTRYYRSIDNFWTYELISTEANTYRKYANSGTITVDGTWIIGQGYTSSGYSEQVVSRSTDHGTTWTFEYPGICHIQDSCQDESGRIWMIGNDGISSWPQHVTYLYSDDDGDTWTSVVTDRTSSTDARASCGNRYVLFSGIPSVLGLCTLTVQIAIPSETFGHDLLLDQVGSTTLVEDLAQRVDCRLRTFQGEHWLNPEIGVPWFEEFLGQKNPNLSVCRSLLLTVIQGVPGVTAVTSLDLSFAKNSNSRVLEVRFTVTGTDSLPVSGTTAVSA